VAAAPLGLAEPLSVAPVPDVTVVTSVVTDGISAGVVNDSTAPNAVPRARSETIAQ
jgi:hypothetical protein